MNSIFAIITKTIFGNNLTLLHMFESPKVNRDLTSSIINFLYEFCCELPNSIGLRVLKE